MNLERFITRALALSLCVGVFSGCAETAKSFTGMVMPNDIEELTKQQRALTPRYTKNVKAFEGEIATLKADVSASLEAKDIMASAKGIRALYELTHPCGEEDCGTYPCDDKCDAGERSKKNLKPLNKAEVFIEREGVDDESRFIRSSMTTLLEQGTAAFEAGELERVNSMVDHLNANLPFVSRTRRGYSELTFETKTKLIAKTVKEAKAIEASDPRGAAAKYTRAAKLSADLGEDRQASDYEAKAMSLGGS
jgi:hypothetical protein